MTLPRQLIPSLADDTGGPDVSVAGYPVPHFAEGFFQTGAWVRLASGAVDDLRDRAEVPPAAAEALWARVALVGAVPLITRERFLWTLEMAPHAPRSHFLEPLAKLTPGFSADSAQWSAAGHVSLAAALLQVERGRAALSTGGFLVAAADSLVDEWSLLALRGAGRLKDADHPTGLMPGEGGAALLVETERAARLRNAEVLGWIESVAADGPRPEPRPARRSADRDDDEETWLPPPAPAVGRAIAERIRGVLPASAAAGAKWQGDLYLDLNGEHWRAEAWGHANVHLGKEVDLDGSRVFLAADSLGDTGAASAPIATAWALWSFDRDQARSAIVVSVADDGATGAIRLSPPDGRS